MAYVRLCDVQVTPGGRGGRGGWLPFGSSNRGFVIDGFDLDIPHAQTTVILGPSGFGKSILLRAIAGLLPLNSGRVFYDGRDVAGVPPRERMIGFLFQNYALYPHFNVRENITAYFRLRKQTPELGCLREETLRRTGELLDVDIAYLLDRSPKGLSGGEKQRVALGRCITRQPALFLLDEPFSNFDAQLRDRYRVHLKMLTRELSITTVYVTHDQREAVLLGDRIAIVNKHPRGGLTRGYLERSGTVQEFHDRPRNRFVAGSLNLRPEASARHLPSGSVDISPIARLSTGGGEIRGELPVDAPIEAGDSVRPRFSKLHVFDRESGTARPVPAALMDYLDGTND